MSSSGSGTLTSRSIRPRIIASSSVSRRPSPSLAGCGAIARRCASCNSSSRMTSARAACCHAAIGFDAAWCCISRTIASRAIVTPFTLTVTGFPVGICAWTEQVVIVLLRRFHLARPPCAHHLIATPADIPDRRAPDVYEAGEREHQEDRHAEGEMQLEQQRHVEDQRGDARLQLQDALRPGHERNHHMAVEMLQGNVNGGEPKRELRIEDQQDRDIAERRGGANAGVEQPAMHQQRDADEAHDAGYAANADCHPLLEGVRDAERFEDPDRRQQAAEVAKEDDQDADMEQVGAPGQLPAAQELTRSAAPGVLLAVEAQHAAEQEHGQAEIGIPAENDVIDQFGHDLSPHWRGGTAGDAAGMSGAGRKPPRIRAISPSLQPSLAPGPKVTCSSSQAASSAAKSLASGSGRVSSAATSDSFGLAAASATSARNTAS